MFMLGGFKLIPLFWLGFFIVIIVHEMGHAYWVRRFGHQVHRVDITGFGGSCTWSGNASGGERALIAWGGVLAQACLLAVALVLGAIIGEGFFRTGLGAALTVTNVFLILLNLLPLPPFDGAEAWKLFSAVKREGWPPRANRPKKRRARRVRSAVGGESDGASGVAKASKRTSKRTSASESKRESKSQRPGDPSGGSGGTDGAKKSASASKSREEQLELAETFRRLAEQARRAKDKHEE